ncbi:MAG: phage terminase large subunit family protein [Thermodesulfovibrionia bacterium]|nr:phage terminase large subunit family protein [Thermodesulfovibrionia bacterium]
MNTSTEISQDEMFYEFSFSTEERRTAETKEKIPISEWAEKYQHVARGNHTGAWRNDITPYLAFVMDMAGEDYVREVDIMGTAQGGKSNFLLNCLGSFIDQDPAEVLITFPAQAEVREFMDDRIIPMIEEGPRLSQYISPNPDDTAKYHIKLTNAAILYTAWANSAARLASKAIKYILLDEVDKYGAVVGKETDPITLARKRKRTFGDTYKLLITSTPTTEDGHINKAFNGAQVIFRYHVTCPDCGMLQLMNFPGIKYPEDKTKEEIEEGKLAWYECENCQSKWSDAKRNIAVRMGEWKRDKGEHIEKPERIAFHIPGWLSPDVSFTEIAICEIESKTDRARLIDLFNDYMAEPFVESEEGDSITEDFLYKRRENYGPEKADWVVPMAASVLTLGVDVQKNRLETEVVAWGEGLENWGIEYRQIQGDPMRSDVWEKLDEYIKKKFRHESGIGLKIAITGIDSGYRAPYVYKFVKPRESKRVYATKGSSTVGKALYSFSEINLSRSKKKSLKDLRKINLCIIGTETAKDETFTWMQMEEEGPGYMHYHKGYPHDYFKQLTSEHAVTRKGQRRWFPKFKGIRNEAFDLRVINYAMLEAFNPDFERLNAEISRIVQKETVSEKIKRPVIVKGFKKK